MTTFDLLIANEVCNVLSNSKKANLDAAIKDFINLAKEGHNINDDDIQEAVFFYNDLTNLTRTEKEYIRKNVEKAGL